MTCLRHGRIYCDDFSANLLLSVLAVVDYNHPKCLCKIADLQRSAGGMQLSHVPAKLVKSPTFTSVAIAI